MKKLFKSRKALSPVVAAIILIAVTVAVSIAVAAWMGALTFTFMQTEQITFTDYSWGSGNAYFQLTVKNTGTADLSIQDVRIDGASPASIDPSLGTAQPLAKGDTVTFNVTRTDGFTSGVSYEFTVITAKGNTFGPYIKTAP